ncbi:MAG: efflux RND transporter periplasmic adaptor subunit [Victivallales bacterium]|nr:efflux RND transporter periplasmic adaptor subunit [Victivallales bacterium]
MLKRISSAFLFVCLFSAVVVTAQPARPLPTVAAGVVGEADALESRRYTGLLVSPSSVELTARVAGELLEVGFSEGDLVKEGQMLYRLDDVRYKAAVAGAKANIAGREASIQRCEASLRYSESNFKRINSLYDKGVTTLDAMEVARMSYHTDQAALASEKAALAGAQAALITAEDDLKNTRILAPISGKIGQNEKTKGNYLTAASGVLSTIVQLDPMRLSFSISSRDFLTIFGTEENFRKEARIRIVLADGTEYPEEGVFEFRNNEVNRTTDTIQFFISFRNKDARLVPGSSVTVLLQKRTVAKLAAIPLTAIMNDATSAFVYAIDEDGTIQRRNVEIGGVSGPRQLIKSGLKPGERIVIDGVHKVRPGEKANFASDAE